MADISELTRTDNNTLFAEDKVQLKQIPLFDRIMKIGEAHEKTGALPESDSSHFEQFLGKVRHHIEYVCEKLELTEIQAILFSGIVNKFEGGCVTLKDLAASIGCKTQTLIKYFDEFSIIEEKNLIGIEKNHYESSLSFAIELETLTALKKDSPPDNKNRHLSIDDFFTQIEILCENRVQGKWRFGKTLKRMNLLLKNNAHLDLVKKIKSYTLPEEAEIMLLRFCHYLINLDEDEMDMKILSRFYDNAYEFRVAKRQLQSGNYILQQKGLIQNVNIEGFGDPEAFSLTDKAKDELLSELDDHLAKKNIRGITATDTIKEKKLFYPKKTAVQVAELTDLLRENNFAAIQKRLSGEGMRTGFACLFSGKPGTGKTETAYQLARLTGRGIIQIDISDTKSMWFGESEKKIKRVFTQYRSAVKKSTVTPILLFNEADAIIGKRRNLGETRNGPDQTENTIQNIILQEIENLDGILIATTNLANNMDKAFERRFLYKIEFETPTSEIRKTIWQTIIPNLTCDEAATLAEQFNFSGGQIENIARRRTVSEVLSGYSPTLEKLIEYCKEEKKDTPEKKVGFI